MDSNVYSLAFGPKTFPKTYVAVGLRFARSASLQELLLTTANSAGWE
jgi:hypothetical protein